MHLLDAPAILALCEEEQHGTCIQSMGLCCSQPGVHLNASMGKKLLSCCYRCREFFSVMTKGTKGKIVRFFFHI